MSRTPKSSDRWGTILSYVCGAPPSDLAPFALQEIAKIESGEWSLDPPGSRGPGKSTEQTTKDPEGPSGPGKSNADC